jgi:hypothetical protein
MIDDFHGRRSVVRWTTGLRPLRHQRRGVAPWHPLMLVQDEPFHDLMDPPTSTVPFTWSARSTVVPAP